MARCPLQYFVPLALNSSTIRLWSVTKKYEINPLANGSARCYQSHSRLFQHFIPQTKRISNSTAQNYLFFRIFLDVSHAFWLASKTQSQAHSFFFLLIKEYNTTYFAINVGEITSLRLRCFYCSGSSPMYSFKRNYVFQFLWLTFYEKGALLLPALWQLFHELDKSIDEAKPCLW